MRGEFYAACISTPDLADFTPRVRRLALQIPRELYYVPSDRASPA